MYTDQSLAGIRELIANSLDARDGVVNITMKLGDHSICYADDGLGIDDFANTYGIIGSGAKEESYSIGMFGIGRLALISRLKSKGIVQSQRKGDSILTWEVDRNGWSLVETPFDPPFKSSGFYLWFRELDLEIDADKIREDIERIFSIPLYEGLCTITINDIGLRSKLDETYRKKKKRYPYTIYYRDKQDGRIHYCHRGIEIKSEAFTGLDAWVDEEDLDIKTDREGYVNNVHYHRYLRNVRNTLRKLRPSSTLKKLEIEFMERVMAKFRVFLKTVKKDLPAYIPEEVKVIGKDEPVDFPDLPEYLDFGTKPELTEDLQSIAGQRDELYFAVEEPSISTLIGDQWVETNHGQLEITEEAPDIPGIESMIGSKISDGVAEVEKNKPKPRPLRGARAVDLGTEYPMMFFDKEPFVLVFNNSHPVMKEMIETETLDNRAMAVLYERMLECFYLQNNNSLEEIKERWTEIDNHLQEML